MARAGNIVTARSDAPKDDERIDFVTDPSGVSFGSGVVARGGTADRAVAAAKTVAPQAAPRDEGAVTPAADLGRAARLDESDPCKGRYPASARVDDGFATIALVVRSSGKVASAAIVSETPCRRRLRPRGARMPPREVVLTGAVALGRIR
jgi:hypothetical protein